MVKSKFTIEDRNTDDRVKLDLLKHPRNKSMTLVREENKEKLIEISSTRGRISVSVASDVSVAEMGTSAPEGLWAPDNDKEDLRNWDIDDNVMEVYGRTEHSIRLDRHEPGPQTPDREVNDILGQPDMTFAVAYALKSGRHSMLIGPTGTGKTSTYRWFAKKLGWNMVLAPIARGTEAAHLVGDYLPTGQALFEWMDGPVAEAIRLSQSHPTLLVFDEINRIGNIAEFSRVYSVLDDTRMLELKERRDREGIAERLEVGQLHIGATANPSDDEAADYMGVQDLDPALSSRFSVQPTVSYPSPEVELEALCDRVPSIDRAVASKMVFTAKKIRDSADVRFPISFRELENWAAAYEAFGYQEAARVTVINKAPRMFHGSIENLIKIM